MNNMKDELYSYQKLMKLISLFQRVNQVSWTASQTKNRYPLPESMTPEEIKQLSRVYVALSTDIEDIAEEIKLLGKDFLNDQT